MSMLVSRVNIGGQVGNRIGFLNLRRANSVEQLLVSGVLTDGLRTSTLLALMSGYWLDHVGWYHLFQCSRLRAITFGTTQFICCLGEICSRLCRVDALVGACLLLTVDLFLVR